MTKKPADARLMQGLAALHSLNRTLELLPIRERDALELLESSGCIRRLAGRRVVLWADAVALARPEQEPEVSIQPTAARLKRIKL